MAHFLRQDSEGARYRVEFYELDGVGRLVYHVVVPQNTHLDSLNFLFDRWVVTASVLVVRFAYFYKIG